nr:hyalin-like [Lytechinus pictus]
MSGSMFPIGTTVVNITTSDLNENNATCQFTVTILDNEAPILNCPNISSTTDAGFNFSSSVILNSTATDNVDTNISADCIPSSYNYFLVGDTAVNCTSTDTAGNTGSCSLVVTVKDDEAPILNCPNITSTTDTGFNFSSSVILNSTATDNVDTDVSAYCIPSSEDDFVVGDTIVNCTSTDTAGNTGSCILIVTVLDDEAPTLNCPNITSTTDTGFNFSSSVILNSTATDNVDTDVSAYCIPSSEDDFVVGDTIVNCTSTDTAGNTGSCHLIVTVLDDEAPTLHCPNVTSTTDTGFNFSSSVMLNSSATDNVDIDVSVNCIPSSEDDFVVGDTVVNCTSTDTAGNTGRCILIVTVLDDEAPTLHCPNVTSTTDTGFNFSSSVMLNSSATDNVDIDVSVNCIPSSEDDFVVGDTVVNCTSTDTAGNTGSCSLIVTVSDDEAPTLNCPNITSTTDTGFNFSSSVILNSSATDNVDIDVSVNCIPSSEDDFVVGDTIVNCTSTDTAGNTESCILIVRVLDDEAPTLNCPNITSTTDTGFNFSSSVILNSTATDNVDTDVSAYCIPSSEHDFVVGDTVVNCTSTDTAGNTGSCHLIVTLLDDEAPTLNCPNITSTTDTGFNFSSSVILNSTATDNVDIDVSAYCIPSSEDDFVVADTIVNCTSTDTAGNTGSCILIVTVLGGNCLIHDEAPVLNCPNITSTTDNGFNFSSSVILNSTATDNVDTDVSAYCIPSSEDDFVVGDTVVNCTSTDTAGNTGSCSLIVTVLDDEAPTLNCPNVTSTTDTGFNFSSSVILNSSATDNVDTDVSVNCIPSSEDDFVVGDTVVNCTSTDTAGSTGSCSLIVTVLDDEAPVLNCPNITSTTDTGFKFSSSVMLNSSATDNVDIDVSANCIPSPEDDFVVGDNIVNCTSTDTAGNTGSCILIVTVSDDEAPTLNCPNITSTTDTGFNFSSSVILNSTATDNVDTDVSAYCIPSSEDDFVVGDTIVNCTSTDTAGNTGSCILIVTVSDDEAPTLNCPNVTSTTDTGFNFSSSVILNSTATDNVDTDVSAYCIPSSEDDFVVGDTIVNCTSTDTAGNTGSYDEAPTLNCPNITSTTDTGFNFSSSVILNSTSTDNVDTGVSAYCIPSSEHDFVVGDTVVNCTSTDTAGNTGSCHLIVTVLDDEAPTLNCPNITSTTDTGFNFSSSVILNPTATDNVDTDVSAYCIPSSEDDFVVADTIVNCTSTDTAGNTGSCILIVTVLGGNYLIHDEAPVLNCPNITSTTDTGFNFSSSVILNSSATDNVDTDVSVNCIPSSEDDFVVGTLSNCTSTDTAGNTGSCY